MMRIAFAICLLLGSIYAQDMRNVTEPKFPQTCASLAANLTAEGGKLPEEAELHLDTARIQQAIDHCVAGRAVELRSEGAHNAFLTGPLQLKPSVTLLVSANTILFGTRNPREYDVKPGSCGIISQDGRGCKPLIEVNDAPHSGVMGLGAIDGQGGEKLLKQPVSWWQLARQAQVEDKSQNCPRLIAVNSSDDFTLYGITLRNSPNFHVIVSRTNGFTAWGVKVDSPANARNTDGIDPSSSTNVTIAYSYIRAGDDNVAIKAGSAGPATYMTIAHNHFYSGHGMSIGSETEGGVSAIRVSGLSMDGADNGIRIKSARSRGGLVQDVSYQNVCIRNAKNPITMDPFYSDAPGERIPVYEDILLKDVHTLTPGKVTLKGFDEQYRLKVRFDGVYIDGVQPAEINAQHARFEVGTTGTNLKLQGDDVEVSGSGKASQARDCTDAFVPFPDGPVIHPQTQSADDLLPAPVSAVAGDRHTATVSADGSAEYMTVQQGIDALTPAGGTVLIKPGTYREVVHVAKPHVRLEGTGDRPEKVVIVNGNSAYSSGSTFKSATVFVAADDFFAKNLTFQNDFSRSHGPQEQGAQALALSVTGDRAIFRNVRILGAQDTLYAASRPCHPQKGPCIPARQYFDHCYIEGHVDFIFGDSLAFFDHCELHAIAHDRVMLTAQGKTFPEQQSGYVFDHCRVTSDPGAGEIFLGRPWRPYATVVFLNSELDGKVNPAGWSEWDGRLQSAFYAEYASSGPGANPAQREPYSHQLDAKQAQKYGAADFLGGSDAWKPAEIK
jgi:polygalacturonase